MAATSTDVSRFSEDRIDNNRITIEMEHKLTGIIHTNRNRLKTFVKHHTGLIELKSVCEDLRNMEMPDKASLCSRDSLRKLAACCVRIYNNNYYSFEIRIRAQQAVRQVEELHSAVNQLIIANYSWAGLIASSFHSHLSSNEDMAHEGVFGLMKAAYRFDTSRNVRFRTYAEHWVRQSIINHLQNTQKGFRIPTHFLQLNARYRKTMRICSHAENQETSVEEIANHLGTTVKMVKQIQEKPQSVLSLDFTDSEGGTEGTNHIGSVSVDMTGNLEREELKISIGKLLKKIPERERCIIESHYGLGDNEEKSLRIIALQMGVTRERARQLMMRGLRMLCSLGIDLKEHIEAAA
jgi:DNA-directed RNA polymerase sigma subunit (sigma70/sigma32)